MIGAANAFGCRQKARHDDNHYLLLGALACSGVTRLMRSTRSPVCASCCSNLLRSGGEAVVEGTSAAGKLRQRQSVGAIATHTVCRTISLATTRGEISGPRVGREKTNRQVARRTQPGRRVEDHWDGI